MSEGRVETLYRQLKQMAVDFRIRPGERLNEVALARELDASRTPLREALNRLVAEQLITFQPGRGFYCRALDPETVFQLYELRAILEVAAVRSACKRASEEAIAGLRRDLYVPGLDYVGKTVRQVTEEDEAFHIGIAALTGNGELVRDLDRINERIRYLRWADMASRVRQTKGEHTLIMTALERRDADAAEAAMHAHVARRMDQIVAAVREGYSNLYVPGTEVLFDEPLREEEAQR
ncbi:GntR family transcriptional regulator [Salinarimonas sp.]|uniref:GntR family transcriptional regulator n=1 Tax=Salinarimonas sp. TaxID=2766526 RepID=UPI0032D8F26F